MADTTTQWILDLVDQVTAPAKKVMKSVEGITDGLEDVNEVVELNEKDTKKALSNTEKWYDEVTDKIKAQERELKDLEQAYEKAAPGKHKQLAGRAFEKAKGRLNDLRRELGAADRDMQHLNGRLTEFGNNRKAWENVATGINQTIEMVDRLGQSMDFTAEITDVRVAIQRMTDMSGEALDQATAKAYNLGKVVSENPEQIAQAALAMTRHVGGSFESNLELIEKGFQKGANINGDFLDQLREYPTFFKEMGLDGSQAIALIAQAGKQGIYSDKAIDSLKEAKLSLSEMTKVQRDALKGIGIKPQELQGLSYFEQIQKVSRAMAGAGEAAKSAVLADVFKGAGEDAGVAWVEGYASIDLDIEKIKSYKDAKAGIRGFVADIESSVGMATGSLGTYIHQISGFGAQILGLIGVFGPLMTAIKGTTVAQWALNIAISANPIGLIIAAIVALIALVTAVIVKYEDWGAAVTLAMGPLGMIINLIMSFRRHWDSIVEAFKSDGIIGGLKRIGLVILDALLMPMQQLLDWAAELTGWDWVSKGAENIAAMREQFELSGSPEETPEKETPEESPETAMVPGIKAPEQEVPNKKRPDPSPEASMWKGGKLELPKVEEPRREANPATYKTKATAANVKQNLTFHMNFTLPESWRNELDKIADAVIDKMTGAAKDAGGSIFYG